MVCYVLAVVTTHGILAMANVWQDDRGQANGWDVDPTLINRLTASVFEALGARGSWQYAQLRGGLRRMARTLFDTDR